MWLPWEQRWDNPLSLCTVKMSWRNWCLVSVSGCRDQLAHWSTTWGPAPSFQHGECSSLSPQGGHFLLCGDLTFPGLLCSLPCVLLLSSKLYPRVCNFWKLLSHITTDNPFCLDSSVSLYLSFSNVTDFLKGSVLGHVTISPLPGVWMLQPYPRIRRCWGQNRAPFGPSWSVSRSLQIKVIF